MFCREKNVLKLHQLAYAGKTWENGVFNMPFSVAMVMDVSESRKMASES